jgi:hypothetical protein
MAKKAKGPVVSRGTVVLKLTLDPEVAKSLRLLSVHRGLTVSQVVADLVAQSPTRLVLQERPRGQSTPSAQGPSSAQGEAGPFGLVSPEVA